MLDDFREHGPVLAIVDGRFLPIDHFALSIDNDAKTVQTIGSGSLDMTTTQTTVEVGLRTRRRPHIRSLMGQNVYLRNRKYKITIEDPTLTNEGATMTDFSPTYDIEMKADSYSVTTTNESFVSPEL